MASQLQTSCRASWWTIGVCILAAALLPGEPLPAGVPPREAVGSACSAGVAAAPEEGCGVPMEGRGCGKCCGAAGKDGIGFFGVRARGWSRCGSICVRVGESRGRFHLRLGEEQHDRLFRKQLQAVGSGVLGAEAVCLLFGSSNV